MPLLTCILIQKKWRINQNFSVFQSAGTLHICPYNTYAEQMMTFSSFTSKSGLKQNTGEKKDAQ